MISPEKVNSEKNSFPGSKLYNKVMLKKRGSGPKKPRRINLLKIFAGTFAIFVIFSLGVMVGQGKITLQHGYKTVNKNLPSNLEYGEVEQLYDSLRENFDGSLDQTKLMDGIKEGLVKAAGDPYTDYFNAKASKEFNEQLSGTFVGIGAELTKDQTNNALTVVSPISGFPADKAGIRAKDIITEIDGKSTADLTVSDAVTKIRGEKGTTVKLKVVRNGKQELTFDIVRDEITIPSVTSKTINGKIGYIKISRFSEDTTKLVTDAATGFKQAGVKGIVLDVRGDPGGLLDAAVNVSSLWLNNKTILTERRGDTVIKDYPSIGTPVLAGIPTVVLIDEGSASASEITAGALHDNKAATLIGAKSFGKGSVQQLIKFGNDSMLKVTIAKWFTPAGININKEGIKPDTEVKRSDDDIKSGKDPQLDAAIVKLNQ